MLKWSRRELASIVLFSLCGKAEPDLPYSLYGVTSSDQKHGQLSFPSVLILFETDQTSVNWATECLSSSRNTAGVLSSFTENVIAIIGYMAGKCEVVVINFDSSTRLQKTEFDVGDMLLLRWHLTWVDGELNIAIQLAKGESRRYIVVRARDLRIRESSPEEMYQDLAIDGFVGGLSAVNNFASIQRAPDRPQLNVSEAVPAVPLPLVVPDNIPLSPGESIGLFVANQSMFAFTAGKMRERSAPGATTPYYIFDRTREVWRTLQVPGGASLARGFGEWLAIQARDIRERYTPSPGFPTRRQEHSATGPAYDSIAEAFRLYQPGILYLHHVPSQTTVVEETGQGDTEVLWVSGERLLYRCDRTLYSAVISGSQLTNRRKVLEQDFVADMHWVCYGPASPAPLDPPWKRFEGIEQRNRG